MPVELVPGIGGAEFMGVLVGGAVPVVEGVAVEGGTEYGVPVVGMPVVGMPVVGMPVVGIPPVLGAGVGGLYSSSFRHSLA